MPTPRLYDDLVWVWDFLSPPEEYPEEVASFREQFQAHGVPDGAPILHLGSGGGSIDWHLKHHYQVTGVDLSPAMLALARERNPEVEYVEGDIRTVRLNRTFAGVLVHDAISYMLTTADLAAAYATAAAHLLPGGVMVALPEELDTCFRQNHTELDSRTIGDRSVTSLIVDFDPDPTDETVESTFVFVIREAGQLSVEVDTHVVGMHTLDQFLAAIRGAGFRTEVALWDLCPDEDQQYPLITGVRL